MELEPIPPNNPDKTAAVYEMLWDCEYCGTTKLLGLSHRFCPQCGAAQNPQKRYFPQDEAKIAVRDHRYCGADRVCPACRTPNAALAQFCGQCGGPLAGAAAAARRGDQIRAAGAADFAAPQAAAPQRGAPQRWGLVVAALMVLGLVLVNVFVTKTVPLTLDHLRWERAIEIEAFGPQIQEGWCDGLPADAYGVVRSQQVRSQRQVAEGEVCATRRSDRGDGTYAESLECAPKYRSEPVYGEYCRYTVNRWNHARTVATSGQNPAPAWGEVRLNGGGGQCLGCEREAGRREALFLYFKTKEGKPQEHRCQVSPKVWADARPGSTWSIDQGQFFGDARCGSLMEGG
ncbi:MAG: hypothetical protein ACKN9T_03795 [Candidatus Methylumidiphilus sp.]